MHIRNDCECWLLLDFLRCMFVGCCSLEQVEDQQSFEESQQDPDYQQPDTGKQPFLTGVSTLLYVCAMMIVVNNADDGIPVLFPSVMGWE